MQLKLYAIGSEKGGFTLEAAIIVPIVLTLILLLISMGLLLCQQAAVQSSAQHAAERGAAVWNNVSGTIGAGGTDDYDLYRRIFDRHSAAKIEAVRQYAETLLNSKTILKPASTEVLVEVKSGIADKRISVEIIGIYRIPLIGSLGILQGGGVRVEAAAEAVIDEPVELIRNTDFIIELEQELEKAFPEIRKLREKLTDTVKDVINRITPGG
ncbi:MAG: TadE/TadG family type IV pilus assembly protein [Eubacteriales bacterium]|nr:TadE/TadG family type IV pilus assembly protein [Eubacteriales bacterium]